MTHSLHWPSFSPSSSMVKNYSSNQRLPASRNAPPVYIKFRTTYRENVQYLKAIGVIDPKTKPHQLPFPDAAAQMASTVNYLKLMGFPDSAFARLAYLCPQLFSLDFHPSDIEPVLHFLTSELNASPQDSVALITKCPQLLFQDVEYHLRPTLDYLKHLGLEQLNVPSTSNAHLLNIPVKKLHSKVMFLKSIGFSHEEAGRVCARLPAIFGYGVDSNLRPKFEYLVWEMHRDVGELKEFPQFFGFSLQKRILPRHLHLKERNVRLKLNRMLLWSDNKFYAKWK